jgi:shikimate dehydrogenase
MRKLYGVIGDPIGHSMSPVMHNDLFKFYGLDSHYFSFHVKQMDLEDAVKGFKAIGAAGFNVTVPHKTNIIPLLDKVDPLAEAIGAVNTVVNENGMLIGYNTDGRGFVQGLLDKLPDIAEKKALIIGAGGAAKAIYFSMAEAGLKDIDICNRTAARAEGLAKACPFTVQTEILGMEAAGKSSDQYDLIIQTTSIGMSPAIDETPLPLLALKEGCFVSDIIYNPLETRFLSEAARLGAATQNGIDMFAYQGALAFEKWTGIFPDTARMKENVLKQLGGSSC